MLKRFFKLLKRKQVLKNIIFSLDGPICPCDNMDISWGIHHLKDGWHLRFYCNTCHTKLYSRLDKIGGIIRLDSPYPGGGGGEEDKPDNLLKLVR